MPRICNNHERLLIYERCVVLDLSRDYMPFSDKTQRLDFPNGFVERLRKVIPEGKDTLLDSAIRRRQFADVLRQLHLYKDVRRTATAWEQFAVEMIHLSISSGRCSEDTAKLLEEIAQKAEITRLYNELQAMLYGHAP